MTTQTLTSKLAGSGSLTSKGLGLLDRIPVSVISLIARIGIAGTFWRSGQTKVDGWTITDTTYFLFREEYNLPLVPPELAANLAVFAEHFFPALLIIGFASRLSALALLGMTLTIQLFVYPMSWPDHATWAAALLIIIAKGPGVLSLDHLIAKFFRKAV